MRLIRSRMPAIIGIAARVLAFVMMTTAVAAHIIARAAAISRVPLWTGTTAGAVVVLNCTGRATSSARNSSKSRAIRTVRVVSIRDETVVFQFESCRLWKFLAASRDITRVSLTTRTARLATPPPFWRTVVGSLVRRLPSERPEAIEVGWRSLGRSGWRPVREREIVINRYRHPARSLRS